MSIETPTLERTSHAATQVIIAANPKAGARSGRPIVDRLVKLLAERGFSADVLTDIDEIEREAAALWHAGQLRALVAAGGDGTVGLILNRTPEGVPIAVLPLGTENLLAKHLGLTADPKLICDTIEGGVTVCIDAGRADGRTFFMVVSCGFDAEVVQRLHKKRDGHISRLSYAKPIVATIRSYQYQELRVYCDGSEQATSARWIFVNNLPYYALGLRIVPDAIGDDGWLDVCTFEKGSFWTGLVYLGAVILGRHKTWKDCVTQRARRVRIESDEPVAYEIDGDPGGHLPVEIEILPGRLTLLAPEKWAAQQKLAVGHSSQ